MPDRTDTRLRCGRRITRDQSPSSGATLVLEYRASAQLDCSGNEPTAEGAQVLSGAHHTGPRQAPAVARTRLRILPTCLVIAIGIAVSGCATDRMIVNASSDLLQHSISAYRDEPDFELARVAGLSNLKIIEALHRMQPDQRDLLEHLAEGFAGAAFAFAEDQVEALRDGDPDALHNARQRAHSFYERGRNYAVGALALRHPDIEHALTRSSFALADYVSSLRRSDVPALFWLTFSELGSIALSDGGGLATRLGRVRALAVRLVELNEAYAHAGALVMLGVIDSSTPSRISPSQDRGRRFFERALEVTDRRFLPAHVEFARSYAVAVGDRALFESTLTEVVEAPDDILPGERLMTIVAKRRAGRLLARVDRLFPERPGSVR